jgi:5,10-methylenetetrahydromethanopterin reductase
MTCEFWLHGFPVPGQVEALGRRTEELGFDGLLLADSQNLVGDPFVALGLLTRTTSRLGLGTGIVNPITRHPGVVASAMASVQREAGGRAVVGVGRGDSSLAQIGVRPPTTAQLRTFVDTLRGYLHGGIGWIAAAQIQPPPVEVAATGPKTIAMPAVAGDRVMLTLGADPGRVAAAVDIAREARVSAGLDPDDLRVGAYVNVCCHPDLPTARDMVRGSTAIFAHFSAMSAAAGSDLSGHEARVVAAVGRGYDGDRHGLTSAAHTGVLDDEFIDGFAVVGSAEQCRRRLAELVGLGLNRVILVPGSRDSDPRVLASTNAALAHEVVAALVSAR